MTISVKAANGEGGDRFFTLRWFSFSSCNFHLFWKQERSYNKASFPKIFSLNIKPTQEKNFWVSFFNLGGVFLLGFLLCVGFFVYVGVWVGVFFQKRWFALLSAFNKLFCAHLRLNWSSTKPKILLNDNMLLKAMMRKQCWHGWINWILFILFLKHSHGFQLLL